MDDRRRYAWVIATLAGLMALAGLTTTQFVRAQGRSVRVGVYENAPKIFWDADGAPDGFFIDLLEAIAAEEGWRLTYVPCAWEQCLADLDGGGIDLMPDVAYSPERDALYDFHDIPVAESWSHIYVMPRSRIERLPDLDGLRVAVLDGSSQQQAFTRLAAGLGFDVTLVPTETLEEAFDLTARGEVDAAIAGRFFGQRFAPAYGLERTSIVLNVVTLYYATAEGQSPELLAAIDGHLASWQTTPESPYYRALAHWIEPDRALGVSRSVVWALGAAVVLLVMAGGSVAMLRHQVRARTRHLEASNAALRQAEQKLRLALAATRDGVWDWYPKTGQVIWSPEAYTMLGYEPNAFEMTLDRWFELLHPDDNPQAWETIQEQIRVGDRNFVVEFRLRRADGSWCWIYGRGRVAATDESGEMVRVIGTHTDVTERKEAELALRESEERYRSLFRNNHAVMLIIDPDGGRIVDANPAAVGFYGWPHETLCRMRMDEINCLSTAEVQAEMDLARREARNHFLFRHRRAGGDIRDVEVYSGPITLGDRRLLYSIVHDVTERREAETAVRAWQDLMQTIIKHDPNAIAVLDRDLMYLFVSDRFLSDYALAETDIIGKHHYDVFPEIPEKWREVHRRALAGEVLRAEDDGFERRDGSRDYVHWECRPWYEADGEVGGIVLYTEVITERHRAAQALQQSERRYRALFEGVAEIVYGVDGGGRFTLLSPAFERLTGWPTDAWIGRPFLELVAPEDRATAQAAWERVLAGVAAPYPDLRLRTQDGHRVVVEIAAAARVMEGETVSQIGFAHDITRRLRAEDETRQRYLELEQLHSASRRLLAAALDPEEMYAAVHQAVAQLMPCEAFAIVLTDEADRAAPGPGDMPGYQAVYLFDRDGRQPPRLVPAEDSLTGLVIPSGQTVKLDDIEAESAPRVVHFGRAERVRSIIAAPFRSEGGVVGMITTQSYAPHAFDDRHRLLLETLAAQFASAIRNAYLLQREQARLQEMELVATVGAALRTAPERTRLPAAVLEQLMDLLKVDGAALELLDAESGVLLTDLACGIWQGLQGERIPPGAGLSAVVLAGGEPFLSNSADEDLRVFHPDMMGACRGIAGVPMVAGEETVGLLWIASRRALTNHDVRVLTAVADLVANAIRRARYAEQVQAQGRRMAQLVASVPEGVLLLEEDGTVLLANPAAEQALAVLAGSPQGARVTQLGDRPLAAYLAADAALQRQEVAAGGRFFDVEARPIVAAEGGEATHWVMVIHESTQEREVRQQLARQERLAAVGQLAAGMAHDFNNILAVVVLYAEMIAGERGLSPASLSRAHVIRDQAHRATDLIGQILDFSRRSPLERQPMLLLPFVKELVRLWERTLPESISIVLAEDGNEHWVDADPTRMQQVLMNLATNARDAMPDGGRIAIALRQETYDDGTVPPVATMPAGTWVRLDFADTGVGMTAEVQAHLFEPFFTTKAPGQGTGLGLAQIHGIVKQHGGEVDVASGVGTGTTVSIFLPALVASSPGDGVDADAAQPAMGSGQRVMVVEDNAVTRAALAEALQDLGYRTVEAETGREALVLLDEDAGSADPVRLVISDLTMPDMGGRALATAAAARGLTVPIIVLSGYIRDEESAALAALGIRRCLHKPIDLAALAAAAAEVLAEENGAA